MSDQCVTVSPCPCGACVKFRETKSKVPHTFEISNAKLDFKLPLIKEDASKPFNFEAIAHYLESPQGEVSIEESVEVIRFVTYSDLEDVTFVNFLTLTTICEYLQNQDLEAPLRNKKLATDFLKKVGLMFGISWREFMNGTVEAEHPARIFRRFLAAIASIPVVSDNLVTVFTDKGFWPAAISPLRIIESICERQLTCMENVMLLCNLTRIEKMPQLLDEETKVVKLIKDKFFVCCRLMQDGKEAGGLLLLLLVNLSTVDGFIQYIIKANAGYFMGATVVKLLANRNLPSPADKAIWPFLRNLSLTDAGREAVMDNIGAYLGNILYPIAGPEELTEEESEFLPTEVKYLPKDKVRVEDETTRECILDILYSLCRFRENRKALRLHDVYQILKIYHLAEKNERLQEKIENLVNILIRKEDSEIEVDDLLEGLALAPEKKESAAGGTVVETSRDA